jgi:CHASE2 domain-containing sensor protein
MTIDPRGSGGEGAAPAWWARILIALGFLCLLAVDPLNAGSASSQRSEQAILRIAAPFYDASRAVTIVLIDDAFLDRIGSGWPMSYREQGLLLRRILAHEPAALFVDLLYRHRHGREPEAAAADGPKPAKVADDGADDASDDPLDLVAPLPGATDAPVPVYFAALTLAARAPDGAPRESCTAQAPASGLYVDDLVDRASIEPRLLAALAQRTAAGASTATGAAPRTGPVLDWVGVSWSGCGLSYPLLLAASSAAPTPAMALYTAACRRGVPARGCDALRGEPAPARFVAPLIVRWGAFAPYAQAPFYGAGVCQRYADAAGDVPWLQRLLTAFRQVALGALFDLRDQDQPDLSLPCPAVSVVRADALLDGDDRYLEPLLHGKAVLVGAQVAGVPDWQASPVHGQVPGVVLHAMALDNLLNYGASYTRAMRGSSTRAIMILLACAIALLAPAIVHRRALLDEATRSGIGLALWLAYAAVLLWYGHPSKAGAVVGVAIAFDLIKPAETFRGALLFALMALLALTALAAGRSPWNWIGLGFVLFATAETMKPYLKPSAAKVFPHPMSLCGRALTAAAGLIDNRNRR